MNYDAHCMEQKEVFSCLRLFFLILREESWPIKASILNIRLQLIKHLPNFGHNSRIFRTTVLFSGLASKQEKSGEKLTTINEIIHFDKELNS